jgi:hypothetical protein
MRKQSLYTRFRGFLSAACLIAFLPALAQAGMMEDLESLGNGSGAKPQAVEPDAGAPPLLPFSAKARVTGTVGNAPCTGFPLSECTGGICGTFQFSGPLVSTAPGKGTINGCVTFNNNSSDRDFPDCVNGSGSATLSAASGAAVNVNLGGQLCIGAINTATATVDYVVQMGFEIKGGAGAFADAVGSGTFDMSFTVVNPVPPTSPGSGIVNFTGNYAKH